MDRLRYWFMLAAVFVIPWEKLVLVPGVGRIGKVVGLVAGLVWFGSVVARGQIRTLRLFHVAAALFGGLSLASVAWTIAPSAAATAGITYVQLFGLVLMIWDICTTQRRVEAAMQAYVAGCFVSVVSLLLNAAGGRQQLYNRFSASGFHVDDIGPILVLGVPFALWLLRTWPGRWRFLNGLYLPLAVWAITLSGTRTAMIASFPVLVFALSELGRLRGRSRRWALAVLIPAAIVAANFLPSASIARLGTAQSSIASGDLNGRVDIWASGLEAFRIRPWAGFGAGAFPAAIETGRAAHSTYLTVAVELGVVGLVLFGLMCVLVLVTVGRMPRRMRGLWAATVLVVAIVSIALSWSTRKQTWLVAALAVAAEGAVPTSVLAARRPGSAAPAVSNERDTVAA